MSETEIINAGRDAKSGRFVSGNSGGPGRRVGSRNRLGEQFVADLREAWETHGVEALRRCAKEEPAQFVRVVASLMPRDLNLNVGLNAATFADTFMTAREMLGNAPPKRLPKGR